MRPIRRSPTWCPRVRSSRAHDLQVRLADVGEHPDVGARDGNQLRDIAGVTRAHLDDRHVVPFVRAIEQQPAHADLVVFVGRCGEHAVRISQSPAAASSSTLVVVFPALPVMAITRPVKRPRAAPASAIYASFVSRDQHRRRPVDARQRVVDHDHRRATGDRLVREVVPVEVCAAQREERVARLERARVGDDANVRRRDARLRTASPPVASTRRASAASRRAPAVASNSRAIATIVERQAPVADDLIRLVTFAGDQHDVARRASAIARAIARRRSSSTTCSCGPMPAAISSTIACGSSLRGLSLVT